MATRVAAKFRVPTGARAHAVSNAGVPRGAQAHILRDVDVPGESQSEIANDVGETRVLDTGTGDGLDTGDRSELAVGTPVPATLGLEILTGAATLPVGTGIRSDAALAVENLGIARGDSSLAGEVRPTYVVAVTLTLSDGRVITYPAPAAASTTS